MKITGVETFPIEVPPPHKGGRFWLFLRLDTDTGVTGYGEVMLLASAFRPSVMAVLIEDVVRGHLVGHDPYEIELLYEKLYARAGYSHYPEQTKLAIISGLEMACWDIVGRAALIRSHVLGGASIATPRPPRDGFGCLDGQRRARLGARRKCSAVSMSLAEAVSSTRR